MADGGIDQALQDENFLNAHPDDQKAYLASIDKDFAAAKPEDQNAYLNHILAPHRQAKAAEPTQFEKDNAPKPYYGFTPGNIAENAVEGATGLVKSGAKAAYDFTLGEGKNDQGEMVHGVGGLVGMDPQGNFNPMARIKGLTSEYLTDPAKQSFGKAAESAKEGHYAEAAGHAMAGATPLVGPWAESLGEQAGKGDIGGAVGNAAGTVAAGELGGMALKHGPDVMAKITKGTPITDAGKLEAAQKQALTVKKPSMTETEYAGRVQEALPELQQIARDNPNVKGPRDMVGAIERRVAQLEAPISQHIRTMNAPEDMVHPAEYQGPIMKAIDADFAKDPGLHKPEEIAKAKKEVMDYLGNEPKSLQEIENNRRRLNEDSQAYYNTNTAGRRAIDVSDATARAQKAAADAIRDVMYGDETHPGELEKAGVTAQDSNGNPMNMRDYRRKIGNLLEIRDHFENAITKAEETGDWKPFQKLFSGPSLAAGGIGTMAGWAAGGPVGGFLGTLAGEGAKAWGDYLRSKNPNLNVQKMIGNLREAAPGPTAEIKLQKPVTQYEHAIGPRIPQHAEPIGPMPGPKPFELGYEQPNRGALNPGVVGAPPNLTWDLPRTPYAEPIGPRAAVEPMTPPIVGEQGAMRLPDQPEPMVKPKPGEPPQPVQQNLFHLSHPYEEARGGGEPMAQIGGKGRVGTIEPKGEQPGGLKPGERTADKYFNPDTEEWAPERQKIHDEVARKAVEGKTPPTDRPPEAIITAGGTAAGKTTMTREVLGDNKNLVNVDSDANKLHIPEYEALKKADPQRAAARVHDESKAISKAQIGAAVQKGLDFVYDTSTGGGGEKLFQKLKDLGYRVRVLYADVPTETAIERARKRATESTDPVNRGRFIPDEIVRKKHGEAAQAFQGFTKSPNVDEIRAFDTTEKKPVEFYSKRGGQEKIHNQASFDRVKQKAAGAEVTK